MTTSPDTYFIDPMYRINPLNQTSPIGELPAFWNNRNNRQSWHAQFYVYQYALQLAQKHNIHTVLDIGCGIAKPLTMTFDQNFTLYGVDQAPAIDYCRKNNIRGTYEADDLEHPTLKLKHHLKTTPLIICADVIEHVENPNHVLDYIKKFSNTDTQIIISTPDRHCLYRDKLHSPKNRYHIREWSFDEFHQYITHYGFKVLEHKRLLSNKLGFNIHTAQLIASKVIKALPLKHTQLMLLKMKS